MCGVHFTDRSRTKTLMLMLDLHKTKNLLVIGTVCVGMVMYAVGMVMYAVGMVMYAVACHVNGIRV